MVKVNSSVKIKAPSSVFPEKSDLVIRQILEKYGLEKIQQEGIKKLLSTKVKQKRREVFENLPAAVISKLIKEYAEGKVILSEAPSQIAERLNISEAKSKQIVQELEQSILAFITALKKRPKTPGEILFGKKPTEY